MCSKIFFFVFFHSQRESRLKKVEKEKAAAKTEANKARDKMQKVKQEMDELKLELQSLHDEKAAIIKQVEAFDQVKID